MLMDENEKDLIKKQKKKNLSQLGLNLLTS